jgi:hypothetical protein
VTPVSGKPTTFYWFDVKGGGRFMYDTIDVGRMAIRMAETGDLRPFTVKPLSRWDRFLIWAVNRLESR